MIETSGDPHHN